ncbi:peptidyl-prolyl cis-trans isomerase [Bacteroides caecicola]|uniref:Peptidyl-prolyl cis-trans isomerase n=1 Tax=Bacteroides caecicola TaxID=1462569 RepID=A0ABS2FBY1_9BACE|nr:peptidylprolyl isomerase [Bacteroides caecicola]MBM6807248.1 peptidyl-prolyl cis-trans isomerase [Bacteroides caecicola]
MRQKRRWNILVAVLLLAGCTPSVDHKGKTPLVEIAGNFLYKEDLQAVMPIGLSQKDSTAFADEYIRNWAEDELLYQKAEGNIPDNVKIDERVAAFRKALVMHMYEEELVNQELGNTVSDEEVEAYYRQNSGMFRAGQPYIQGLFMKVPLTASQLSKVRGWYKRNTQDAIDNLSKYGIGNAVSYEYFYDRWIPLSDIAVKLPLKALDTDRDYLNRNRNVEVRDTAFCYFLHVENFLPEGEQLPLEYARSEIKEILINLKRVDFINRMKQDLYKEASEDNDIVYYK